jgi:hypothetical protein
MSLRRIIDTVSVTVAVSALSMVLGYAAGRLVEGAPDAALWVQAASSLCLLAFAGVQVWLTVKHLRPIAPSGDSLGKAPSAP